MDVAVLGPLAVDGREVPGARLRALLVPLLLVPGRVVSTGALLEAVWGEDLPAEPTAALQALVSRVRRTTGVPVELAAGGYRVPAGSVRVDLRSAEDALRRARAAAAAGDAEGAALAADAALALWPAGAGIDEEVADRLPAADAARAASTRRDLLLVRGAADLARGVGAERLADLQAEAAARPLDEPLTALVVRALAASGRPGEALARFEEVRAALAEYGSDPSAELRAAHEDVLRGRVPPPTPAPAPVAAPVPAPAPAPAPTPRAAATGWVPEALLGRDQDLAALVARVEEHPLVTLVGPGGVGKTSLVAALAATWRERGEPVHDVPLAGVRAGGDVLPVVLAALGGRGRADRVAEPPGGTAAAAALRRTAALARGLLVLDNCEHLLDAVADVVLEVCAAAPGTLRVVATSRAPLGVLGEHVQPLEPLADPDAVALVRRRAAAVRPGWSPDPDGVAELCRRLDNLPLALELAAARLRTTPLPDLLAGLDDRFRVLVDGPRGLPARHRSLQALVDWSWELLSADERVLLRRLSVFPAGAAAAAVSAVCAGDDLPAAAVPAALAALVDASLVVLDADERGRGRYRLLETVRQYAEGRLGPAERDALSLRQARWAAALARRVAPRLAGGGDQVVALAEASTERDALAAALRWSAAAGQADLAAAVGAALVGVAVLRGANAEAEEWVRALAPVPSVLDPSVLDAGAVADGADLALRWTEAVAVSAMALVSAMVTRRPRQAARSLLRLRRALARADLLPDGVPLLVAALRDTARGRPERALAPLGRLVEHGPLRWRAWGLLARAWVQENNGLGDLGMADARASHAVAVEAGNVSCRATSAVLVGQRLSGLGRVEEALVWLRDAEAASLTVGAEADALQVRVLVLRLEASADRSSGGSGAARVRAEVQRLAADHPQDETVRFVLAALAAEDASAAGDWPTARAAYRRALADASRSGTAVPQLRAVLLSAAAGVEVRAGDAAAALPLLREAVDSALASRDVPAQALVGDALGAWCAATGDPATARTLWALAQRFQAHLHDLLGTPVPPQLAAVLGDDPGATPEAAGVAALDGPAAVALLRGLLAQALRR